MCGIVGYAGSFALNALATASRRQAHRGPDDAGRFDDPAAGIGLAHVRLSILDLSPLAHQPMASEDGSAVIVFNGEIYNFRELRAELTAAGRRFRSHSDTEVLLQLYLTEGEGMLKRLNGIFAFAIWNAREQSLFVARDALGVKPLYYAQVQQGFAFASELKALLELVPQARELDPEALHRYLTFLWCPGEATPLRAIRKLLPGEAMVVQSGRITRHWKWYELPIFRGVRADLSEDDAVRGTADALRRAVQRQLVSDVPVGAFLSGGLDSSSIVAFAKEQAPDIRCFTIELVGGQDLGTANDLPYARRAAQHLGVALEVVRVDAAAMARDVEAMVQQLDEPLADPAALNVLYISRLAREHGVKVLLSGAGGDDFFTGYRRHIAVQLDKYWNWLPAAARAALERMSAGLDQRNPVFRRVAKAFRGAALEGDMRVTAYFAWARDEDLRALYSPEFRAALGAAKAEEPMLEFLTRLPTSVQPLDRMLALEQRFFLADHNLTYTDKMSMCAGVEVRVPFLDVDLVEHAARVPLRLKQRGLVGKWVLKKAMEPYLPREVIYRAQTGFGAPLRRWLKDELKSLVDDVLSADVLKRRGVFDPLRVSQLVNLDRQGRIDASYTIFSMVCIELWCRRFLDPS